MDMQQPTLGHYTFNFLSSPAKLPTVEFFGIAFVVLAAALYWSRFVNELG